MDRRPVAGCTDHHRNTAAFLDYMNGREFRAVFTNGGGSVTTTAALLTVT